MTGAPGEASAAGVTGQPEADPVAPSVASEASEAGEAGEAPEEDVVTPAMAAGLHGLLDAPGAPPGDGEPLPPLWHWLAFLPRVGQRFIGPDGHPVPTAALAEVAVGRRMFAGGELRFGPPLTIGRPLRRRSTIAAVEEKQGRSGPLRFVTVRHELTSTGGASVTEDQHLVYRPVVPPTGGDERPAGPPPAPERWDWEWEIEPGPTLLFRFSALTYNAHRIHYDRPYATDAEGYPGLVVHGPLQAIALAEIARRSLPDRIVASFSFRALRPAFDGRPLRLAGRRQGDELVLAAFDHEGYVTMRATARTTPPTAGDSAPRSN